MADQPSLQPPEITLLTDKTSLGKRIKDFPWWFVAIILIAIWAFFIIFSSDYVFTTSAEFVINSDIDQISDSEINQISEQLREVFSEEGITLTQRAILEIFIHLI